MHSPAQDEQPLFGLQGGALTRAAQVLGLARERRLVIGRAAAASVVVAWLPLLVLALAEGVAFGPRVHIPLLADFLTYGRFFVTVPLLIVAEAVVEPRLRMAIVQLRGSGIVAASDLENLDRIRERVAGLWRGRAAQVALIVLTYGLTLLGGWEGPLVGVQSWHYVTDEQGRSLTMAGLWHLLVSAPILRFLALRWAFRLLLWVSGLWQIARLQLFISPAHPDRAGGLAFLGGAQASFAVVIFALSVQVACTVANAARWQGADVLSFQPYVLTLAGAALVLVHAPLLAFAGQMAAARLRAEHRMGQWASHAARYLGSRLEEDDVARLATELGGVEVSTLADANALFENIRVMRVVPLEIRHAVAVAAAAVLPCAPLLFLVMPAREIFQKLLVVLM